MSLKQLCSVMATDGLPDEGLSTTFEKLVISPTMCTAKMVAAQQPNPFLDDLKLLDGGNGNGSAGSGGGGGGNNTPSVESTHAQACRDCSLRRRSESSAIGGCSTSIGNSLRTPLKRIPITVSGHARKMVLREPVLRALKKCCARRKLYAAADENSQRNAAAPSTTVSASAQQQQQQQRQQPGECGPMSDFGDLIRECETILNEDVKRTNFSKLRSPHVARPTRPRCSAGKADATGDAVNTLALASLSTSLRSISPLSLNRFNASSTFAATGSSRPNIGCISNTTSANNASTNSSSSSTSCSQQAGNSNGTTNTTATNAAGDDVTIDELASYFDTFVHIPKKMSSMAEMMYT